MFLVILLVSLFSATNALADNYNICKVSDSVIPGKIRIEYTQELEGTIGGFIGNVIGQDITIDELELYYNHPSLNCYPINEIVCQSVEPVRNTRSCYVNIDGHEYIAFFMMLDGLTIDEINGIYLQLGINP